MIVAMLFNNKNKNKKLNQPGQPLSIVLAE
jgi:hypothetical protein